MIQKQVSRANLSLGDIDNELNGSEVIREWVSILHKFQESNSGGPYVSSNTVFLSTDAFRLR